MAVTIISGGLDNRPPRVFQKNPHRKIGLLGSATHCLKDTPWDDPTWELWGHASSHGFYSRMPDVFFEMHRKERWARMGKKGHDYPKWLRACQKPIYMHDKYKEVPGSIKYPKDRILQEYTVAGGRQYFTNTIVWMLALALSEGVHTIGLWGISYAHNTEYATQRGCAEWILGVCHGRGVQIVLPKQCTLLREPKRLYGYDSHDEKGDLYPEYVEKKFEPQQTVKKRKPGDPKPELVVPTSIMDKIKEEEAETSRPLWATPGPAYADTSQETGVSTEEVA